MKLPSAPDRLRQWRGVMAGAHEGRSPFRLIAKNTLWLAVGQGVSGLVMFFIAVYLARSFGVNGYGQFAFALSYVMLFATLFDFGLSTAVTRELARDTERIREFPAILMLKSSLGLVVILIVVASTFLFVDVAEVRVLVAILAVYAFLLELLNLFYALFRSQQRMELETRVRLLQVCALGLFVLGVGSMRPSLRAAAYAFVGGPLLALAALGAWSWRRGRRYRPVRLVDVTAWRAFLAIGWYLALAKGVGDVMMNTDSVILGAWGLIRDVGWYNAAVRLNGLFLYPMALVSAAIFPALVAMLRDSPDRFVRYWLSWMRMSVFAAGLIAAGTWVNARGAVNLFFGREFGPSVLALEILVFTASLTYVHNLYFHALLVLDMQKKIFRVLAVGAIVNVALNLALVPAFQLRGAAIASVIAHAVVLGQFLLVARGVSIVQPLARPLSTSVVTALLAGTATALVVRTIPYANSTLAVGILLTVASYSFAFVVFDRVAALIRTQEQ